MEAEAKVKELESDIKEITKMIYGLSETQKVSLIQQQVTTDNINLLTKDMKEALKATLSCDVVFSRLDTLDKGLTELQGLKNKIAFMVVGSVIVALLSIVVRGAV